MSMSWSSILIRSFAEDISSCCRACVRIEAVRPTFLSLEDALFAAGRVCETTIRVQLFATERFWICGRASVRNDNNRPGAEKLNLFNQGGVRLSNSSSLESCVLEVRLSKFFPGPLYPLALIRPTLFRLFFLMSRDFVQVRNRDTECLRM